MQVKGFQSHAARNRRLTIWFILSYLVGFQLIAGAAVSVVLIIWDFQALLTFDLWAYFSSFGLVFLTISLVFLFLGWRQQKRVLKARLKVELVTAERERRFAALVQQQAILQGIRRYRLGVIESEACNALTIPDLLSGPLIVATRGLLDSLNDDEISAVIAHELAHVRAGDGTILSLNSALHRTAHVLQIENVLRPETWHFLILALLMPFLLPMYLLGGLANMVALRLAWRARRAIALGRDHIADGESIRFTHFPEALIGAIRKCGGKGYFPYAETAEPYLFEGRPASVGGTHADNLERIAVIERFAHELRTEGRVMRDTRQPVARPPACGRKQGAQNAGVAQGWQNWDRGGPVEKPAPYDLGKILLRYKDVRAFDAWDMQRVAYYGWKPEDRRNIFGLKPDLVLPTLAGALLIAVVHYPGDAGGEGFASAYLQGRFFAFSDQESLKCALGLGTVETCPGMGS